MTINRRSGKSLLLMLDIAAFMSVDLGNLKAKPHVTQDDYRKCFADEVSGLNYTSAPKKPKVAQWKREKGRINYVKR